jgi:tetratricopeptide (TPR) repeat protein
MGTTNTAPGRKSDNSLGLGMLLIILTFLAYLPALSGGFIWDDDVLITENRVIRANDGLHRLWLTNDARNYWPWPLTSSAWWLEWRLWGNSPAGYHVVNVLLHAINAVLVWMILRRLKVPGAWQAGCIFALHPVNVATAAWISEQKNTLSMLFYAVAILLYLRFDEERRWRWYGLSLTAFLLALLSKTAVVMLPVVLLGCVWWMRGRVRRADFLRTVPFFVASLVFGLMTIWFQRPRATGGSPTPTEGFLPRLVVAGWTPWFYLGKTLLPDNLSVIYPKWDINSSLWISYVPGLVMAGCLTLFWWKRNSWGRPLLFGLGYFVVTLFPVSGLFHQTFHLYSFVADHWAYHAIVGVIALVVASGVTICRCLGQWGRYMGAVVLIVLGAATWQRSGVYANEETLWRDTIRKNPRAFVAYLNLGKDLTRKGRAGEAICDYQEALRINPDFAEAHNNLGTVFLRLDEVPEAIKELEQALRLQPNYVEAHNNLGTTLARAGRLPEAIKQWEEALRLKPDFAPAHNNLGNALQTAGKVPEAIGHYEEALRIDPDNADAHNNLGNALLRQGKVPEAIEQYTQALALDPDFTAAQNSLVRLRGDP